MFLLEKMKMIMLKLSKSGKIPNFDFKPKSHYELGENLNMLRF